MISQAFNVLRPATDAPSAFLRIGALMPLAATLAPHTFFRFGSQRIRPNLFALIVANSSILRKSEAIRWTRHALTAVKPEMLLPSAGSPEGLVEALRENPSGTILYDEFARLLARSRKDFASDMPQILCELYDCAPIRERRREGGLQVIERPVVSLLGASAPAPLLLYLKGIDCASGLLPRFLLVYAEKSDVSRLPVPPAIDEAGRDALAAELKGVHEYVSGKPGGCEFVFDSDALDRFKAFDAELLADYPEPDLGGFVERHAVMALKIAAVMAYDANRSFHVKAADVEAAEVFVRDSLDTARSLISMIAENEASYCVRDAGKIKRDLERLAKKHPKGVPHSVLLKYSRVSALDFRRSAFHLIETGDLLVVPDGRVMSWLPRPPRDPALQTESDFAKSIAAHLELARAHFDGRPSRGDCRGGNR